MKPNIRKTPIASRYYFGKWICEAYGYVGGGETPDEAYISWKRIVNTIEPEPL